MKNYKWYSVALNKKEDEKFNQIKSKGFGIKKIFMQGMNSIVPVDETHVEVNNVAEVE